MSAPVIAIDGPSGAGKGTLTVRLARRLGYGVLDSGALYRIVAHAAAGRGIDLADDAALVTMLRGLEIRFPPDPSADLVRVVVDGIDVSDAIRDERVGEMASRVAASPAVRDALMDTQRAFRKAPGLVADGRDMGTVVFPDAELKVFLTADAEARALRRHKQLKDKGLDASLAGLLEAIRDRDARDASRSVAPLRPAADAVHVDSTRLDADAVLERVLAAARERGLGA